MLTQHDRQFVSVLASELRDLIDRVGKSVDDIYATCHDQG